MGVSVFVHSIKNQLLAARVAYKKLEQELAKPEQDEKKLEEYLHLLQNPSTREKAIKTLIPCHIQSGMSGLA